MKEFNEAAAKLFGKVDSIGEIEKSYYESLKVASSSTEQQ